MEAIENKIKNLNSIINWNDRINEIKNIKYDIDLEINTINNQIASIENVIIIKKEYDIDKIISDFEKFDINKKIKYYQYLNSYIQNIETELFDNEK